VVPQTLDARLEVGSRVGIPCGPSLPRHGITACECDIQYVGRIMGRIAINRITIAKSASSKRSFADQGRAVIAVGIAPDAIDLTLSVDNRREAGRRRLVLETSARD
jgi:hypothetical protein